MLHENHRGFRNEPQDDIPVCLLFLSWCKFCKIPLHVTPSLFCFLPHLCRSIFRVHSNTLSLSCLVPLTYFMAHRQRQEECLLLSVVSRSVGQRRRMRASFPPSFVSCPPFPANPYENYSRAGLRLWWWWWGVGGCWWWPHIFPHLVVVAFKSFFCSA